MAIKSSKQRAHRKKNNGGTPTGRRTAARASMVEQPGNPPPATGYDRSNSMQGGASANASSPATSGSSNATATAASRPSPADCPAATGRHNGPAGGPAASIEYSEPQTKRAPSGHPIGIPAAAGARERPLNPRAGMVALTSFSHRPRRQAKGAGSSRSDPASLSSTISTDLSEAYAEIDRLESARGDQLNGRVVRPPIAPCAKSERRAWG